MKYLLIFSLTILFNFSSYAQNTKKYSLRFISGICRYADICNLTAKYRTCPLLDSVEQFYNYDRVEKLFTKKIDFAYCRFDYEITQWEQSKCYYILRRKSKKMVDPVWSDSLEVEIPCNKYYPYDDTFLIRYDTIENKIRMAGGNGILACQTELFLGTCGPECDSYTMAEFRMAQYNAGKILYKHDKNTDKYFEFNALSSDLCSCFLIIRIPKVKHRSLTANTWEMIYYTTRKDIPPGNKEMRFYEVKLSRSYRPESYEEFIPKYRLLSKEEAEYVFQHYMKYVEYEESYYTPDIDRLYSDSWKGAWKEDKEEQIIIEDEGNE